MSVNSDLMRPFLKPLLVALALAAVSSVGATTFIANPAYQSTIGSEINVGNGALFTVSSYGDLNAYDNGVTGPSLIRGNVAVGGSGNFTMSDGDFYGDLYMHTGGKITYSGPANRHRDMGYQDFTNADTVINAGLQDYWNLSASASTTMSLGAAPTTTNFNLAYNAGTGQYTGTVNGGKNYSITSSGRTVLNLQDFVLTSGSFTLSGTATTTYIINVSHNFSINNAHISLSGISSSQVLFNVLGTGSQVSLNQGTYMTGILLAAQRKVDLSGGKVFGRAIGNQVIITSGGQVVSQ